MHVCGVRVGFVGTTEKVRQQQQPRSFRETRWISGAGSPWRVLSMLGSLERWSGVVLPVVPSHPPEILVGVSYSTYCDLD